MAKRKSVKAWGIKIPSGRLLKVAYRTRSEARDNSFLDDTVVRVEIREVKRKRGK